ncbi:MAG: aspartate aminotransferase family protein [Clostridia bacterium]|nr:aspartate aminotransferase family protein [Clostridia bacterium]
MNRDEIIEADKTYIASTYARANVVLDHGEGATLYDKSGKTYIDCATGIGVNCFGINDPVWKEAVEGQIEKIQHICNLYYSEPQAQLASLLCSRTGAKRVFFANSGAEANECAIKTARKYSYDKYGDGRYEIITLKDSFHGRTMATLTATGQDEFHKYFMPFLEGIKYAAPTMASIRKERTARTCAIMIEVIQGESGVHVLDADFLKSLDRYCKENDILLICDEVQCGNGRTGYLYAYEAFGLHPDIVTTAKALAGGLPLGACMMFDKCQATLTPGDHGTTFGGNPVACAGAVSIISRIDRDLLLEIQGKGAYLAENIKHIKNVLSVSGMGLMIGIETTKPAGKVAAECAEKGLIVLTAHTKVRLLPPFNIRKDEMDEALKILNEVISA